MNISAISFHLDQNVKLPQEHVEIVDGLELKINDVPGLVKKDLHQKIKSREINPNYVKEIRNYNFYELKYDHNGKKVTVQIPLYAKDLKLNVYS